jgi:transposase-like protein
LIIVDRGPWYRWALERLGLRYRYLRFGLRSRVERFFGYLRQRTRRFYNNINSWSIKSVEDYAVAIAMIRNLLTIIKVVIIFCVTVMFLEQTGSYANPVLDIIF